MLGVFDSGLGGLTVVKVLQEKLPNFPILYFGDIAHLPYGTKNPKLISRWTKQNLSWLQKQGASLIIIGCHTASAITHQELKKEFPLPLFEMTAPLLKIAREVGKEKRLGIIGTPATIKSGFYQKALEDLSSSVFFQACPLFVPLVEENWIKKPGTKEIVNASLAILKEKGIEALILACTHYPLLEEVIKEVLPGVEIFDPAQQLVSDIQTFFEDSPEIASFPKERENQFFFSAPPYNLSLISQAFLGREIKAKIISSDD
jgi:glutamate racemase